MRSLSGNGTVIVLLAILSLIYSLMLFVDTGSEDSSTSVILKYSGDIACLLIVLCSYGKAYSREDIGLVLTAFLFTLGADALFLFANNIPLGIACFCFAHLTYIKRYKKSSVKPCAVVVLSVLAFCAVAFAAGAALPYTYIFGVVYGGLLFMVTYYAFLSNLPRPNKSLAKAGMIFFIANDASNAIMYILPPGSPVGNAAGYFVWVFYIPALALLALSVREYRQPPVPAGDMRLS